MIVRTLFTSKASGLPLAVTALIFASLLSLWLFGLYRRLNWLRWLTVAVAAGGLLSLPWVWDVIVSNASIYAVRYILFDTDALLLCLPQADGWYGASAAA